MAKAPSASVARVRQNAAAWAERLGLAVDDAFWSKWNGLAKPDQLVAPPLGDGKRCPTRAGRAAFKTRRLSSRRVRSQLRADARAQEGATGRGPSARRCKRKVFFLEDNALKSTRATICDGLCEKGARKIVIAFGFDRRSNAGTTEGALARGTAGGKSAPKPVPLIRAPHVAASKKATAAAHSRCARREDGWQCARPRQPGWRYCSERCERLANGTFVKKPHDAPKAAAPKAPATTAAGSRKTTTTHRRPSVPRRSRARGSLR